MMKSKSPLWTSADAATATHGDVTQGFVATGVSINTRTLQPGDLFIALVGPNVDGHDYVATAFEKGAVGACVSHRPPVFDPDTPLLMVEDTMQALKDLGEFARLKFQGKMIAVTGSVGKTGTKEALNLVLGDQGKATASLGSLNNQWGSPLSLSRMVDGANFGVMELGMNHPGELGPLSKTVRPHVCLVTTVQPAHTEFFDSTAQIAQAKAEIFQGAVPGWSAVLNGDIKEFAQLEAAAKAQDAAHILTFGENEKADFRLQSCELGSMGSDVVAMTPLGEINYHIASPGKHWVLNSLGVLAAVHAVGADVNKAAKSLSHLSPPEGRGQRFDIQIADGSFTLIDESYNASPAAIRAALDVIAAFPLDANARRICVLGDMMELGDDTPKLHSDLAEPLISSGVDLAFLTGEAMQYLWDVLPKTMQGQHSKSSNELARVVKDAIKPGDVVMVKGSAGSQMGRIVETLRSMDISKNKDEG